MLCLHMFHRLTAVSLTPRNLLRTGHESTMKYLAASANVKRQKVRSSCSGLFTKVPPSSNGQPLFTIKVIPLSDTAVFNEGQFHAVESRNVSASKLSVSAETTCLEQHSISSLLSLHDYPTKAADSRQSSIDSNERSPSLSLPSIPRAWTPKLLSCTIAIGCVIAVVVILFRFDRVAASHWPYTITINSVISILVIIQRASLLTLLTLLVGGLAQLKWLWF